MRRKAGSFRDLVYFSVKGIGAKLQVKFKGKLGRNQIVYGMLIKGRISLCA